MRAYWKGDGGVIGEFARRLTGSLGPLRPLRQAAARQHQLRHRARRLHAARPRLLQREAQRGQRRGQPRRQQQQPVVELRRRRPDRRPADPRPARAPEAQLPRHAAALARRADAGRRRRVRAARRAATTTPTARTTRSAGSTGHPRPSASSCSRFVKKLLELRRSHPTFRRQRLLRRPRAARQPAQGPALAQARRPGDEHRRMGARTRALPRHVPGGRGHRRGRQARAADRRRRLPVLFNAHHEDCPSSCPDIVGVPWTR